jgi:RNA recognition motif-containing protein
MHATTDSSLTSLRLRVQGYGTVKFEDEATAQAAIEQFNGSDLEGRTLQVKLDAYA